MSLLTGSKIYLLPVKKVGKMGGLIEEQGRSGQSGAVLRCRQLKLRQMRQRLLQISAEIRGILDANGKAEDTVTGKLAVRAFLGRSERE